MQHTRCILLAAIVAVACAPSGARSDSLDFDGAKWIWSPPASSATLGSLSAGVTYFRAELVLPAEAVLGSAEVIVTCDNLFALYLNGHAVGESSVDNSAWQKPARYDVKSLLVPGRNVVAVEGVNTLPGPAALLLKLAVRLEDGRTLTRVSDATWKSSGDERLNWPHPDFDDQLWIAASVVGEYGASPWGRVTVPNAGRSPGASVGEVHDAGKRVVAEAARRGWMGAVVEVPPSPDFTWPEAIVYVGDDCSLYRPPGPTASSYDSLTVTIFNPRKSRGFPEHDLPAPMKVGRTLNVLRPARPGVEPRVILDAGRGAIGSPSVTFDGRSILFSMAPAGESFFHIYRMDAGGGRPERVTEGPFHDIDPTELPDGRIVFTSTRIGTFEEYHNPPSRALFSMDADGGDIRPITHTIIFDNEPEVLADGRIIFIRTDNFFDRGKVETLLHAIHPDGTEGYTEFGLHNGPEYGSRLRAFVCGSPAPMPDGRVAFISGPGITVGKPGSLDRDLEHFRLETGDVAALPDGRLLCTLAIRKTADVSIGKLRRTLEDLSYRKIAVLDPRARPPVVTTIHESPDAPLHSPVALGARRRPPALPHRVDKERSEDIGATGFLYCQDARNTRNTTAGWSHVRAIRVLAGNGLTTRSSHSYIVHAGNETVELGTVPLAPDGSFLVEVPANTPLALQAVDAEGRSELNEMSWIYVRPGEQRSCAGCHQTRQKTPAHATPFSLALRAPPVKLLGGERSHRFRGNNAAVTGLMELQFDRYREVAGINRHGATPDPLATGASEVNALAEELREGDEQAKIAAAQRLSIFRDPAAAPALAKRLRDRSREVRVAAAMAMAACGTRASVPPLLAALSDRDAVVAQAAAVALENLTGHAEPFNGFVSQRERRSQAGPWRAWFSSTSWDAIERDLIERLSSGDRDIVRRAAVALGHVGGEASRAALRSYVEGERENNPLPAWRKGGRHRGDGARFNSLAAVNPRSLQAAVRSLGYLRDTAALPMLAETLARHRQAETANLFLAEAVVEALGRIATPEAEAALVEAFAAFEDYPRYTNWYGDHEALMACHASPVHYFVIEALDAIGSQSARSITGQLIRSVPIDPDRALLLPNDDYETLTGRVIRRSGTAPAVVETCLALLGDPDAKAAPDVEQALAATHRSWAGDPDPENRAAQILGMVCRDRREEPRIRAAFERYRRKPTTIPRVFDTGIPVVLELPVKHWVCFFLARALGHLRDPRSVDALIAALREEPAEAASGRPDPQGPGVLFLHNDLTPCWRAAAAWALGRIGDRRAVKPLLAVVADLDNATDTRHAAAEALGRIADPASGESIRTLAASYPEVSTRRALLEACRKLEQKLTADARGR